MVGREDGRSSRERRGGAGGAGGAGAARDGARRTGRDSAARDGARGSRDGRARQDRDGHEPRDDDRTRPGDGAAASRREASTARKPPERDAAVRSARAHRLLGLSSTRRAAALALVVCAVVLSVAVPLRNYLAQRGELTDTVQQQEKLREQVDGLERRKAQLSDPAQVEVEARNRLRYVRPGETPYVVQVPSETPSPPPAEAPRAGSGDQWYDDIWKSIAAGNGQ